MFRRLGELGFIIGLFFVIVALILAISTWMSDVAQSINIYTAIAFFLFGMAMMGMKNNDNEKEI
jgi:hypothetical protein